MESTIYYLEHNLHMQFNSFYLSSNIWFDLLSHIWSTTFSSSTSFYLECEFCLESTIYYLEHNLHMKFNSFYLGSNILFDLLSHIWSTTFSSSISFYLECKFCLENNVLHGDQNLLVHLLTGSTIYYLKHNLYLKINSFYLSSSFIWLIIAHLKYNF